MRKTNLKYNGAFGYSSAIELQPCEVDVSAELDCLPSDIVHIWNCTGGDYEGASFYAIETLHRETGERGICCDIMNNGCWLPVPEWRVIEANQRESADDYAERFEKVLTACEHFIAANMGTYAPHLPDLKVIQDAQFAFWAEVVKAYPDADGGDFAPLEALAFDNACADALTHWLEFNT